MHLGLLLHDRRNDFLHHRFLAIFSVDSTTDFLHDHSLQRKANGELRVICELIFALPKVEPKKEEQIEVSDDDSQNYTPSQMLNSTTFWKAFICIACLAAVGKTVISMARDLALSLCFSVSVATTLVGLLSVCNGLGRVATGVIFDKLGRRKTMIIANVMTSSAATITLLSIVTGSGILCIVGLCLTGLSFGTCPTISSAFISECFGNKFFAMNFPIMNCNLMVAAFIATGSNMIFSSTGSYVGSFILLVSLTLVALVLNLSIKR